MPRHVDRRLLPFAVAERLVTVRRRGSRDRISAGRSRGTRLGGRGALEVHAEGEQVVFVPRDLGLTDPERTDLHLVLRPFIRSSALFVVRTAHRETAAGYRDHFEADFRPGDGFGVRRWRL